MSGPPRAPTNKLNIYRVEDEARWLATIQGSGVQLHQSFADTKLGGKRAALKAAIEWRNAMRAQHPTMPQSERMQMVTVANTSGVPGVFYWHDGKGRPYWKAQTTVNRQTVAKAFSVARYGYAEAFKLAAEERKNQIERMARS
ncbi:AP2/ERF family transcription factor [Variovorax sp. J22R133]|uniref:AP2/ERF family transcription factor n=1 Tax=Variovorax brevis TaxID=3053503 RepID=UPI002575538E|nr:AP2/ERF family transcription factor [Variovorax sp. J22R133]MDM0114513.1 AP2/ERF family transcription factor [Variovorax sp. J22R133]